jgi:poly(3-hydroxyalkanoate) synthetase
VTPCGLGRVSPRSPGDGRLAPIEDAPGSYVRVRSDD